ncbi:hypothetical protein D3C79_980820 [compost metagenome]
MEDIELVKRIKSYEKHERKIPVGTFGIVTKQGEEITVTWVESNLRKNKPNEKPTQASDWMIYQLQSMFAKWKEDTSCNQGMQAV